MVKRSILQLYRATIFLPQLSMAASDHLFNKCDQTIEHVINQIIAPQIPEEKLQQLILVCYTLQAPSPERITVSLGNFPWCNSNKR